MLAQPRNPTFQAMKILIGYDGSRSSDAAIDDLAQAGLPAAGTAMVISVAEVWVPPTETAKGDGRVLDEGWLFETRVLADHARKRVESRLPGWEVNSAIGGGSPAAEILAKADEFDPDLIVVGSEGRSAQGRVFFGSTAQKVVTEARSSVRIGRGKIEVDGAPVRSIVAFDGSEGAFAAIRAVAERRWPAGSEIRIISVAERLAPSAIGRFVQPADNAVDEVNAAELAWLEARGEMALEKLAPLELEASYSIIAGKARQALVEEAARWNADCIFLGAAKKTGRRVLGSTAAAVAARASSSVEVVRER